MLRINLGIAWGLGLMLLTGASIARAQSDPSQPMDRITSAGIAESRLIDISVPSVNDPAAVDMLFKEGNTITSILEGLKEKGFHIKYKEKHFLPSMTLQSLPKATRIDEVLQEILEPWNFRVYRSPFGHWMVARAKKKKESEGPDENTRELLERYKDRIQDEQSKPSGN